MIRFVMLAFFLSFNVANASTKPTIFYADKGLLDSANREGSFGFYNWEMNKAKEVSGLPYNNDPRDFTAPIGSLIYTIIKKDGNNLLFGV